MARLIQIAKGHDRAVALVEEPQSSPARNDSIHLFSGARSHRQQPEVNRTPRQKLSDLMLDYDADLQRPIRMAHAHADRSSRRTLPLPRFRHWPDASRQREKSAGHARHRQRRPHRQHENVSLGYRRRQAPPQDKSVRHPNGFTKAAAQFFARTMSRWKFPPTPKMAAKKPKSPGFTLLMPTATRTVSAWLAATNSPTTYSKRRII